VSLALPQTCCNVIKAWGFDKNQLDFRAMWVNREEWNRAEIPRGTAERRFVAGGPSTMPWI
jgi:hypothetical protein